MMRETEPPPDQTADPPQPIGIDVDTARLREIRDQLKSAPPAPESIGDYRVVRKIDKGGMGVVYEARHPLNDQRVALKLIRPGLMTPHMLRRFEYEATVLAKLDHSGIARVFYAGIWDGGAGPQPYFAMEYVEGKPLDEYLRENRTKLKLRQLVELLHAICDAVQHAHGKGIVHRDLKPDNILITSEGKPKILDFGVARAVDADSQAVTMQSETGAIIGTVPYMAPEQIRGQVDEIEQATDVYALGVIGYELLADRMPYAVKGKPLPEAARMICEDEPSRLSSINKCLRGDVETIVQKALEKEKTRRYSSAGELAADVKRYLDYEPITARPPSTWYNLRKFAKRNKVLVGGVAATLLVLVAGVIASTAFALEANRQRREAEKRQTEAERRQRQTEAVVEFITDDVFANVGPDKLPNGAVRDLIFAIMLEPAIRRIDEQFQEDPSTLVTIQASLAAVLHALGRLEDAEPLYREALERRRRVLGEDHPDTLTTMNDAGHLLQAQGKLDQAEPLFREGLERRRGVLGDDHPDTLKSLYSLGALLVRRGRLAEAEPLRREAMDRARRNLGDDHPATLTTMNNMGYLLEAQGKLDQAERLYRAALRGSRRTLGDEHPITLFAINNLGLLLHSQGRSEEAEPLLTKSYRRGGSSQLPPRRAAQFLASYGSCLVKLGRHAEASVPLRVAFVKLKQAGQAERDLMREVVVALAEMCEHTDRPDEAAKWRAELAALEAATRPSTAPATGPALP